MQSMQSKAEDVEVAALRKRLKQLSKNELVRLVILLGNDIGFLKAQNIQLDEQIVDLKGEPDEEVSSPDA